MRISFPPRWACYAARHKTFITVKVGLPEEKICVLMRYSRFFRPDMKASLPSFTYTEASSKLLYTEYRSVRPWSEERFMSVLKEHLISTQCEGCFQYISCTHTRTHIQCAVACTHTKYTGFRWTEGAGTQCLQSRTILDFYSSEHKVLLYSKPHLYINTVMNEILVNESKF